MSIVTYCNIQYIGVDLIFAICHVNVRLHYIQEKLVVSITICGKFYFVDENLKSTETGS